MSTEFSKSAPLFNDIKSLIDSARQRAAVAVNAELTLLYWQVGRRIHSELLGGERAEYGQQVLASLAKQLTGQYGRGWGARNLANMVRFAECFPDTRILHALSAKLSLKQGPAPGMLDYATLIQPTNSNLPQSGAGRMNAGAKESTHHAGIDPGRQFYSDVDRFKARRNWQTLSAKSSEFYFGMTSLCQIVSAVRRQSENDGGGLERNLLFSCSAEQRKSS